MPIEKTGIENGNNIEVILPGGNNAVSISSEVDLEEHSSSNFVNIPVTLEYNNVKSQVVNKVDNLESEIVINNPDVATLLGNPVQSSDSALPTITLASEDFNSEVVTNAVSNSNDVTTTQSLKRQLSSTTPPVVHKVIITKNPNSDQPQVMPVQVNQLGQLQLQQGHTFSVASSGGISLLPQGAQTPTKTITITPQGVLSPGKQYVTIPTTPTKVLGVPGNKVPISPALKTPTKITMIPVTIGKSPQRLVPASSVLNKQGNISTGAAGSRPTLITMSPSKVMKEGTVVQQRPIQIQPQTKQIITMSAGGGIKQVQIPKIPISMQGSRFQYVRLVSPSSPAAMAAGASKATTLTSLVQPTKSIAPALSTSAVVSQANLQQFKITLPAQGGTQIATAKPQTTQQVQRILLPATPTQQVAIRVSTPSLTSATSVAQIRPAATPVSNIAGLPPGTTLLSSGSGLQGFALVPASYVTQLQQQQVQPKTITVQQPSLPSASTAAEPQAALLQQRQEFVPIASSDPSLSANLKQSVNGSAIEATGARPRKPCNCTKSQCLKLYCDCFANGEFCHNCNCNNCANNLDHEEERSRAIKSCLDRNPMAFHPKIGKGRDGERDRRHNKGCNCKRSGCLKNYCECYEAKIMCSSSCKCVGCKNFEESPERKTLMHLADAAEVRVQQQTAAKTKLSSQISGIPSRRPLATATGERLPYTFLTSDVAEATCACLLAQAEEAERLKMPPVVQERMVIEEFGRCLLQIIESANKTKENTDT
ncbi:protein lin-54 homolog isoform X2 [Ostrea edulis]|uniref:protein lin-54 homolog isoform X2 n=1 Tax=Ostrea edulis TaxID=37623 RepID=UPI0024AEB1CB|nr:protein lin-54 homolog isoform X2 [Ostrea edulis]